MLMVVPLAKLTLQVDAQMNPEGEKLTVPVPLPRNVTVNMGPAPPPVPLKHTTLAVMLPVTMAPEELRFPALVFVCTVAEIMAPVPQTLPVAVSRPVELTVTI
jgi:hypothetical protein